MEKEKEELRLEEQKKAETGGDNSLLLLQLNTPQSTHTTPHSHFKPLTLHHTSNPSHTLIERHTHTHKQLSFVLGPRRRERSFPYCLTLNNLYIYI